MRPRLTSPLVGLLLVLGAWLLACRQPGAELQLPDDRATLEAGEPSGRGGPSVFVEAPSVPQPGPVLNWTQVDDRLADLVGGDRYRVDYDADHPWVGASSPLVTIVVFADYQCPYCQRFDDTLMQLLGRYPDRVRVVFRQFPLPMHREARFAAGVALAAHAQGQFVLVHEWLYDNNRSLSHAAVAQQAGGLGLDVQRMLDEVDAGHYDARVDADMSLGARFGVTGTPSYFINGRKFSGAHPIDELETVVEEELALAERLIAAGSERREVWARIMAASADTPPAAPPRASPSPSPSNKRFATALAGLPERGASSPKIELLMCGDFDCPYCKKATATLADLLKNHPKELAIYFRHHPLPMHKHARAAHRAAVAAENQGKFWEMFDLLYTDPKKRSDAELEDMARQLGLNMKRFRKDIAAKKTDERIDEQATYCEQDLAASGTPTFFINGRKLVGARPLADFEVVIQEELSGQGPP